jgi:hypothetical protein
MFIVVKNLHAGITADDLEVFVKPVLKGRLFQKKAELRSVKIVVLVDKHNNIVERHGLITISPDSEKARLIKALNNRCIGEKKFSVAEYVIRHWSNDRRTSAPTSNAYPQNQRINDRRRSGLRTYTMNWELDYNLA